MDSLLRNLHDQILKNLYKKSLIDFKVQPSDHLLQLLSVNVIDVIAFKLILNNIHYKKNQQLNIYMTMLHNQAQFTSS
ncbi:unnamed protein product [Paramecium sonneborni]|uniref:Uncharacterized protein n=1 Tax=Paramecium sonneborni TaxID=65129 RepID=A0A8S1RRG6_9CILI|nr:unnamed protein product [Paramecium sonneborni]CAD8130829.1 unnamed protein product [Paramecium sonneborni]